MKFRIKTLCLALCMLAPSFLMSKEIKDSSEAELPYSIKGSSFIALMTSDAEKLASWYESNLGLKETKRIEDSSNDSRVIIIGNQGLLLELIESPALPEPPVYHLGLFKAGFYVDNIETAHNWMKKNEVVTRDSVVVDLELGLKTIVVQDCDNNYIQLIETL